MNEHLEKAKQILSRDVVDATVLAHALIAQAEMLERIAKALEENNTLLSDLLGDRLSYVAGCIIDVETAIEKLVNRGY